MAVPFRRTSKTKKRMRRTHFKLEVSGLVTCSHCGAMTKSHTVCPTCGYYDGKPVIAKPTKATPTKADEGKKKAKPAKAKEAKPVESKEVKPTKAVKTKAKLAIEQGKKGEK